MVHVILELDQFQRVFENEKKCNIRSFLFRISILYPTLPVWMPSELCLPKDTTFTQIFFDSLSLSLYMYMQF